MTKSFGEKDKSRYNSWRKAVYKKFDGKCATCSSDNKQLHAHHITTWFENNELRYDIDNGLPVCKDCHCIIHGYSVGGSSKILNNKEKLRSVRKKYISITKVTYKRGFRNG